MRKGKFWKIVLPFLLTVGFGVYTADLFVSKYKPQIYSAVVKHEPIFIKKPIPSLTEEARVNKIEGTVSLRLEFDESGRVRKVETLQGLPFGLTENAIEAAYGTEVEPFRFLNRKISFTTQINYNFKASK